VLLFIALRRAAVRGALAEPKQRGRGGATPLILLAAVASILIVGSAIVGYRAVARSVAQYALDQARAMVDFQARDLGRWLEAQRTNAALLAANDQTLAIADRASLRGWNREASHLDLRGQAVAFGFAEADFIGASGHSLFGAGGRGCGQKKLRNRGAGARRSACRRQRRRASLRLCGACVGAARREKS
jgi:hypothetical protein